MALALLGLLSVPKGGAAFLLLAAFGLALVVLGGWARGPDLVVDPGRGRVATGPFWARKQWRVDEIGRVQVMDGGKQSPGESTGSFDTWLLNLVLKSGERHNLSANSDREATRGIGERLARSLGVPFSPSGR
jgi:hypothetical protein